MFRRTDTLGQKRSLVSTLTFSTWMSDTATKVKPENAGESTPNSRSWTKGIVFCSWVMGTVLSINIILTIIAAGIAYSRNGADDFSFAAIYTGSCSRSKNWTTGLHLVINILSTAMLGASNYCMQCLASPSRAQVDEAHSQRRSVAIGVPNIWNLVRRQRGKRQLLGGLLLVTSLPVHMIYNSAIFFAFGPTEYSVVVGTGDPFQNNGTEDWNNCTELIGMDVPTLNAELGRSDLKTLSNQECIDTFAQDYVSGQRLVVLVTKKPLPEGEPVVFMLGGNAAGFSGGDGSAYRWMCGGENDCSKDIASKMLDGDEWTIQPLQWSTPTIRMEVPTQHGFHNVSGEIYFNTLDFPDSTPDTIRLNEFLSQDLYEKELQAELDNPSNWVNASFPGNVTIYGHTAQCQRQGMDPAKLPETYPVEHCLTVPVEESCQLVFSPPICLIVIGCNIIKLICALFTASDSRDDVFMTIGDAISSYLTRPDPMTEGCCLLSKSLINKGTSGWHKNPKKKPKHGAIGIPDSKLPLQLPPQKWWFQAVGTGRWVLTMTIFACIMTPAAYLLHLGMTQYYKSVGSRTIWDTTLGEASPSTTLGNFHDQSGTSAIFSMVLLANLPQILVSLAYFMLNALLTVMLGAVEYNNYSQARKPLRVSWPQGGEQRSTYYLSLPYRYSVPLLIVSAVLHWLVSQSFFFVEVIPFDMDGNPSQYGQLITVGHSPVAIIFSIAVGGSLFVVSMLMGLRRFKSPMPIAGQHSAAISAASHPTTSAADGTNHALKPVQWGEVAGTYSDSTPMTFSNRIRGDFDSGNGTEGADPPQLSSGNYRAALAGVGALEQEFYHCTFTSDDVSEPIRGRVYI